ncbi:MAG: hypothetical protein FJ221_08555 [Lentisphaerae bacterium]|nr:hypothetical protein [Lentisphaerota bacterium]
MKNLGAVLAGCAMLGVMATAQDAAAPEVLVPGDSEWKWLHPTDGVDPAGAEPGFHEKFSTLAFDDSKWASGKDSPEAGGGFGYGDPVGVTWDTPEKENRKTGYLRRKFTTKQAMKDLVLSLQRDDGVIVYLDGREAGRDNMADGPEAYALVASAIVSGEDERTPVEVRLSGELPAGEHVLAISLHNRDGGSTDLRAAGITLKGVPSK